MRRLLWVSVGFLILIGAARAVCFLAYCWYQLANPLEAFHLESKMVHLAWRVQAGEPLYPDWRAYPYISNFFGPGYSLLVGGIGKTIQSSLDDLFTIGRLTTMVCGALAAVVVGVAAGSRYGKAAGITAAVLSLGAVPMEGFGAMVRGDLMADLLGFSGFLVAVSRRPGWRLLLGGALLVAAVLTKQTTGMYLIAAALALALTDRRADAVRLSIGVLGLLGAIIVGVTLTVAPRFLESLLAEGKSPLDLEKWSSVLGRLLTFGPDLLALAVVGLVLWSSRTVRDVPLLVLTLVVSAVSFTTSMKLGADLNYFLGLRMVAALGAGALVGAARIEMRRGDTRSPRRTWNQVGFLCVITLIGVALLPSLAQQYRLQRQLGQMMRVLKSPPGRTALSEYQQLYHLAADPSLALLTDSGPVALRQRERAPFVDPWLFRMLVVNGRIDPKTIQDRLESESYDLLITTHDLRAETYDDYEFGLPPVLAQAARGRYVFVETIAGMFAYVPRRRLAEPTAPVTDRSGLSRSVGAGR